MAKNKMIFKYIGAGDVHEMITSTTTKVGESVAVVLTAFGANIPLMDERTPATEAQYMNGETEGYISLINYDIETGEIAETEAAPKFFDESRRVEIADAFMESEKMDEAAVMWQPLKHLVVGAVFEDSNENTFEVIETERGFELLEDRETLLEDGTLYVFETLQEIEDMFSNGGNPISSIEGPDTRD